MRRVENLSFSYGKIRAVTDVSFEINAGEIFAIIGANGAGKSSLMKCISGICRPQRGNIYLENEELPPQPHKVVENGISLVPEGRWIFPNLTVEENMELSLKGNKGVWQSVFHRTSEEEKALIDETLKKVGLEKRKDILAGSLAHGEKQWLEIAMQFVQKPEIILLDEPAAGMGKPETIKTGELLKEIKKECTIIVVEHDMDFVKQIADCVTVLHEGKILMEGDIHQVLADETVQAVYLGRGGERNA